MNDTPTPRTDALWHAIDFGRPFLAELNDHSRQLERELAEARVQRDALAEALKLAEVCFIRNHPADYQTGWKDAVNWINRQTLAAVKGETK